MFRSSNRKINQLETRVQILIAYRTVATNTLHDSVKCIRNAAITMKNVNDVVTLKMLQPFRHQFHEQFVRRNDYGLVCWEQC